MGLTGKLYLGESPADEMCALVGEPNYAERARKECNAYRAQLRRMCGKEPEGAVLVIVANPHDFGTYYSVEVRYDPKNEVARDYVFRVEDAAPSRWDAEARLELELGGK